MHKTRVSIVAGFLGSGKTSLIKEILANHQGPGKIAVLVNEIGDVGIDGDIIREVSGTDCEIKEMAGGCICCTANVPFRQAVVALLRHKPDRLIVEPTGVAAVTSVRDVFSEAGIAPSVELDPVLVLMDPRQWNEPRIRQHPLYIEQCEAADVVAMSHIDCCDDELVQRFTDAHTDKALMISKHGVLSGDINYLNDPQSLPVTGKTVEKVSSKGILKRILKWAEGEVVDIDELEEKWRQAKPPASMIRCKGIIQTKHGPLAVQSDGPVLTMHPAPHSTTSALVCILLDVDEAHSWFERLHLAA
jgi:G3E family GTPase